MSAGAIAVLRKAAEVMGIRGLTKGENVDSDGCVCLYGALDLARRELNVALDDYIASTKVLEEKVREKAKEVGFPLPAYISVWNDRPESTKEEMVALLKETAEALSRKESENVSAEERA